MIRRIAREAIKGQLEPLQGATSTPISTQAVPLATSARVARALVALLDEELRLAPEHIQQVVDRELGRVQRARNVHLRVHPDDLALLDTPEALRARQELRGPLSIEADPSLTRGGCVLDTDTGQIDAQLETRLSLALALLRSGVL